MKIVELKRKIEEKFNSPAIGLSLEAHEGDHHRYKIYYKGKLVAINFRLSHGNKGEIGPGLTSAIAHQLGIKSQQVKGIVSCSFWGKNFVEESNLIPKT